MRFAQIKYQDDCIKTDKCRQMRCRSLIEKNLSMRSSCLGKSLFMKACSDMAMFKHEKLLRPWKVGQGHRLSNSSEILSICICASNFVFLRPILFKLSRSRGKCWQMDGRTEVHVNLIGGWFHATRPKDNRRKRLFHTNISLYFSAFIAPILTRHIFCKITDKS